MPQSRQRHDAWQLRRTGRLALEAPVVIAACALATAFELRVLSVPG